MKLIAIQQQQPILQLTWVINNICTNACSYCPAGLHEGKNHHYDWNNARKFVEILLAKHDKINLSIAGGEPTVSPHLIDLVKMFHDAGHNISVTTNGVRTATYYKELSQYLNNISFSYHPSFPETTLLDKIESVKLNALTNVRIMMDARYWQHAENMYNSCLAVDGISVEPVRIQDWGITDTGARSYSAEQIVWFDTHALQHTKYIPPRNLQIIPAVDFIYNNGTVSTEWQNANKLMNSKQNDFRGWECDVGLESLFVHYDGKVQRANCRQGNPRFIGSINDPNAIVWPTQSEICQQPECHCPTDIIVSKRLVLSSSS